VSVALVPLLVLAACGDDDDDDSGAATNDGDGISVVASFYPVAEAAERIGGDRVEVTNLTPAGTEPHDLELTPDQVGELEDADLVLYLGQGFQPAVAEIAERRDGGSVDLLETIDLEAGAAEALEAQEASEEAEAAGEGEAADEEEHEESGLDPHFWLDPQLMTDAVDEAQAALSEASPEDAETFQANAQAYEDELAALDDELATGLGSCERDQIVTSHAAFFYLAQRYGLTQLPISGLSPESEPDADRLAELADQIEAEGITTVFYETLVSPDVAETLAREAGVETAVLNPIEGLTPDQVDAGDDYISVMRDNLAALHDSLGCS
jgi:zinc transport system substrate-binding protein